MTGEALVLEMGEPVRIGDVARTLIERVPDADRTPIVYTGLRPGEKLHETLFGELEPRDRRPRHDLISHVPVPPLDLDSVDATVQPDDETALATMREQAIPSASPGADQRPWATASSGDRSHV